MNNQRPRPGNGAPNQPSISAANIHPSPLNTGRVPPAGLHKTTFKPRANPTVAKPYTPEEAQKIQTQLNRVLGPEYVSCRPGGGGLSVSYIEGWKALNLANEIFGFNGWSSELISVQVDYLDSHGSGRVSLGLSVVVRITIKDGTFHEDFGYGNIENAKNKAVAFEKCKKEAFTDALKRCLRCFGNVLGNCLYDRGIVAKMQKVKLPELELEWDDFHRHPLIMKREIDRGKKAAERSIMSTNDTVPNNDNVNANSASTASSNGPADATVTTTHGRPPVLKDTVPGPSKETIQKNPSTRNATSGKAPSETVLSPSMVKEYELDDFDDLYVFSDDLPADVAALVPQQNGSSERQNQKIDRLTTPEQPADTEPENTPGEVFFTSSRKALDVQKAAYQEEVPVFDHKFVATSVKRTVDPSKSAKVRRTDVPTLLTPSQVNSGNTVSPLVASTGSIGKRPLGMPPTQRPPSKRLHRPVADQADKENGVNTA